MVLPAFNFQVSYFFPDALVLPYFALEKTEGNFGFCLHARRREQIEVFRFIGVVLEVAAFHPAFIHQRLQTIVQLAQTHSQLPGQLPLSKGWIALNRLEDLVGYFVFQLFSGLDGPVDL